MTRTKRNTPIQPKEDVVVLGYDIVASYINYNQKVLNTNQKNADKLSAEGRRKV